VTSDTMIARLHAGLQIAMGWEDLHLHQFRIYGRVGGMLFADRICGAIASDQR